MEQDEKIIDFIKDELAEIKTSIINLNTKFDTHITSTCRTTHMQLESRISKLEVRVYAITAGIMIIVNLAMNWYFKKG